jgi:hypothetical protein
MAKTNGTFKLGKEFKTMIALTKGSQEQRNGWKRMFIDAQHSAEIAKIMSKKSKKERSAE